MEPETTTWPEFPNGGKASAKQSLRSKNRNESKKLGLLVSKNFKDKYTSKKFDWENVAFLVEKTLETNGKSRECNWYLKKWIRIPN